MQVAAQITPQHRANPHSSPPETHLPLKTRAPRFRTSERLDNTDHRPPQGRLSFPILPENFGRPCCCATRRASPGGFPRARTHFPFPFSRRRPRVKDARWSFPQPAEIARTFPPRESDHGEASPRLPATASFGAARAAAGERTALDRRSVDARSRRGARGENDDSDFFAEPAPVGGCGVARFRLVMLF